MPWLLFVAGACSDFSASKRPSRDLPESFADPDLTHTGASPVLRLDLLEGRYTLPASTLPAGFRLSDRFPITLEPEPIREKHGTQIWRGPSPFDDVEGDARVAAPDGMIVYVGDDVVPYSQQLSGRSWKINGDQVVLAWPSETAPAMSVAYTGVGDLLLRRDFGTAGLPAAEFVRHTVTFRAQTRVGMLLPAPATAAWDVTLPTGGATFAGELAIAPIPVGQLGSDGATVSLTVVDGADRVQVGTMDVPPGKEFVPWRLDLGAWAGKAVTLEIASSPGATPDFDHVFVGSPTVWGPASGPARHVVVIGLDTTRPDHFGFYGYTRDTTPELDAVARTSTVFTRAWTPAPRTRPSFRSAFTGRNPLEAVGARNIADVFRAHGFATAGIVANVHLQPRFDFHQGFDAWWYDGASKANQQVDRAIEWLSGHADRDTFLFLHLMDPHLLYKAPAEYRERWEKDPDPDLPDTFDRWQVYGWMKEGKMDDRRKEAIVARYDAELSFTSAQLGRLFAYLDTLGPHTLVVLHSDHGEEFWEHGEYEHNHTVYEETTRGLLWFRSAGGQRKGRTIDAPVTLTDIAPTLAAFAGFDDAPPSDGRSLAPLVLGTEEPAASADRAIGVAHLRYGTERWGVVWRGHKYVLHTGSGREELYDLAADPKETTDLAAGTDLAPYRAKLVEVHAMDVGPGWRIAVRLRGDAADDRYEIGLPAPALRAEVIDPEALVTNPSNRAWGELPRRLPSDVGTVTLSDDRRTLTFLPGSKPDTGLISVSFEEPQDATALVLSRDGAPVVTVVGEGGSQWKSGSSSLAITPGIIVFPPPNEAARISALGLEHTFGPAGEEQRHMLIELGYLDPAATPD
jgi:arylsulfatase A-like enzyme